MTPLPGVEVDQVVSELLVELVNPVTLEVALAVQQELQARLGEADRLRKQQVERVHYEAELSLRAPQVGFSRRIETIIASSCAGSLLA